MQLSTLYRTLGPNLHVKSKQSETLLMDRKKISLGGCTASYNNRLFDMNRLNIYCYFNSVTY